MPGSVSVESLSAVTLAVEDMDRSVDFYESLGFEPTGRNRGFTTFALGVGYLNLESGAGGGETWGRVIFHVSDVDAMYRRAIELGLRPQAPPRDAEWGERYFHLRDPDGHELSFARPLDEG